MADTQRLPVILTVLCGTVLSGVSVAADAVAAERLIDIRRSTVTVRVATPGATPALERRYLIVAPLSEGTFDEAVPHVQLVIDGRRLRVVDGGRSNAERRQVQSRMLSHDVLDVDRFRWISFHSVTIEQRSGEQWLVHGELGMHGTVRPLTVPLTRAGARFKGSATVTQSDYGIVPVSLAGGIVTVRDDIQIEFDIVVSRRTVEGP